MKAKKGLLMLNYLIWILRFAFLSILFLSIGIVIAKYVNLRVDISSAESAIIAQRILSSNEIMFTDNITLRTYPAFVDVKKMQNPGALNNEIDFGKSGRHIAANVALDNKKRSLFLNKRLFEEFAENLKTIFASDVAETRQDYFVFVYEDGQLSQDKLAVRVLQQR